MDRKLAVLGSPIAHSKSPAIHTAAYDVLGLPWTYERRDIKEHELEAFLAARGPEWLGFSVTMPLKEKAFDLSNARSQIAARTSVVNTLRRTDSGWEGTNTDVGGLLLALQQHSIDLSDTVVLGAGATAVSAVLAAQTGGATRIRVRARRIDAADHLARTLGVEAENLADPVSSNEIPTLVISTLPGTAGSRLSLDPRLTQAHLFDVAYDPSPSPLTSFWTSHGGQSTSGIDMLIFQAVLQIRWFLNGSTEMPLPREDSVVHAMRGAVAIGHSV